MKKTFSIEIFFLISTSLFGQINLKDSTAQVIGYWGMQEKQSYDVSFEKLKIEKNDTLSRELIKYEVDISVIDSTENSYTIAWLYKNHKIETENEWIKKLNSITDNITVTIKTDEFGAFIEVVNWKEIRDYLVKITETLKNEIKEVPGYEKILSNIMNTYATKESIEANAIKDVLQFYKFHGVNYSLGEELTGKMQTANNYGGKPFDTEVWYMLDEIDGEDGNSILKSNEVIDSDQLTDATYKMLKENKTFGKEFPSRKEFPPVTHITDTASRIHGDSGWVLYSVETKQIKVDEIVNIEERIIEIK